MPAGTVSIAAAAGKKLHRLEKPFGDAGHLNYMPPGVALGHAHSLRAAAVCVNIFLVHATRLIGRLQKQLPIDSV
jgi:hypothetical protein